MFFLFIVFTHYLLLFSLYSETLCAWNKRTANSIQSITVMFVERKKLKLNFNVYLYLKHQRCALHLVATRYRFLELFLWCFFHFGLFALWNLDLIDE